LKCGADVHFDNALANHCLSAKTCLKNIIEKNGKLLNFPLKNCGAPMITNDHPEINEADLLSPEQMKKQQILVGCAKCVFTVGRHDIQHATSTLLPDLQAGLLVKEASNES
jgi:hypothetical protein